MSIKKLKTQKKKRSELTQLTQISFCGTFTAKGLKAEVKDGKLAILQEGQIRKLVGQVDQITFSGKYAQSIEQPVLYVTEIAVFELKDWKMLLTEIAPGIDLEKDILANMDFAPEISPDLKEMDADIFRE